MAALRWGFATTGNIVNDFVTALKALPKEEHELVAVAARSLPRAEEFAAKHGIAKAYEGYDQLAKDPQIQVVYVGALNPQHCQIVTEMLENGKHVVCEKPLTMNEKQTRKIVDLARKKKLFLMEAIWSRFFPVYQEVRKLIDNGTIGEVRYASVTLGFPIDGVDRITKKELGGGATLDLGVYILQFQQFAFRGLAPSKVTVLGSKNAEDVDLIASAVIAYPDNRYAQVMCDATVELPNEGVIVGTKGIIRIPTFYAPSSYILNGVTKEIPLIKNNGKFYYNQSTAPGLAYEAAAARKLILEGKIESDSITHEESIQLAAIEDEFRRQIGVTYPADQD